MKEILKAKGSYDLRSVVFSHGWSDLPPFRVESVDGTTSVVLRNGNKAVLVHVHPAENGIEIESSIHPFPKILHASLKRMFRLEEDLTSFYDHARSENRAWIEERKMGRLLRSQTVFEDLVKLILTTNCSWSFTRKMTEALTNHLGIEAEGGLRLFPDAEALASKNEKFYRDKIRAGYRSAHLPHLGKLALSKKLDPESWMDPTRPTEVVRKEILSVPGAGPYVAENMLRFLGRYQNLGLDSWARGKLKKIWGMKKNPSDKTIHRKYKSHGDYRGLVLWCDLTQDWLESADLASWIRTSSVSPANQ